MKKKLNLDRLNKLQKTIETLLISNNDSIIKNNVVDKKYKGTPIDTVKLLDSMDKLFVQLDIIKLAIDTANKKNTSLGSSNKVLILKLSNLNRKKKLLEVLFNQKLVNKRKNGEVDAFRFQITKTVIEDKLREIEEEIAKIKEAMTDFNITTIVKVEIDESLNLIDKDEQ